MSNSDLYNFNVWFYSFFLKLIPCIILTLVTALLVRAMIQVPRIFAKQYLLTFVDIENVRFNILTMLKMLIRLSVLIMLTRLTIIDN